MVFSVKVRSVGSRAVSASIDDRPTSISDNRKQPTEAGNWFDSKNLAEGHVGRPQTISVDQSWPISRFQIRVQCQPETLFPVSQRRSRPVKTGWTKNFNRNRLRMSKTSHSRLRPASTLLSNVLSISKVSYGQQKGSVDQTGQPEPASDNREEPKSVSVDQNVTTGQWQQRYVKVRGNALHVEPEDTRTRFSELLIGGISQAGRRIRVGSTNSIACTCMRVWVWVGLANLRSGAAKFAN